jgi:hypothetical protein
MSTFKLDTNYTVGGGYNSAALPIVTDVNSWTVFSKDGVIKMPNPTMKLGTIGMNEMGYRMIYTMLHNTTAGVQHYYAGEYLSVHLAPGLRYDTAAAGDMVHGAALPMMAEANDGLSLAGVVRGGANAVMLQDIAIPAGTRAAFWAGFEQAFIPNVVYIFGTVPAASANASVAIYTQGTQFLAPNTLPFTLIAGVRLIACTGTAVAPTGNTVRNFLHIGHSNLPDNTRQNPLADDAAKMALAINGILTTAGFTHA